MDLEKAWTKFRKNPRWAVLGLTCAAVLTLGGLYAGGFLGEVGRRAAEQMAQDPVIVFQVTPQVRFSYYLIEGTPLLDRAVRGFGFTERDGFASRPRWLQNEVLTNLQQLFQLEPDRRPSGLGFDVLEVYAADPDGREWIHRELTDRGQVIDGRWMPRSDPDPLTREFHGGIWNFRTTPSLGPIHIDSIVSDATTDSVWYMNILMDGSGGIVPWDEYTFVRGLSWADLEEGVSDPITARIVNDNLDLTDVALVQVSGNTHGSYVSKVHLRELSMLVLGIENVGDAPIGLHSLRQRLLGAGRFELRTTAEVESRQSAAPTTDRELPIEMLTSGEHLFVPLRLEFGMPRVDRVGPNVVPLITPDQLPQPWPRGLPTDSLTIEVLRRVDRDMYPVTDTVRVAVGNVAAVAERFVFEPTYLLGAAVDVTEVVFRTGSGDDTPVEVRQFDPFNLIARGAYWAGSCPILYAHGKDWSKRLGPVLVNAVTQAREQTETIVLPPGTDVVVLAEEEQEISYLDLVRSSRLIAAFIRSEGRETAVSEGVLRDLDGERIRLDMGDSLIIRLLDAPTDAGTGDTLVVGGFYVPNSLLGGVAGEGVADAEKVARH